MPPSIDMFWLIHAVYYGLPGGILMIAAFLSNAFSVGYARGLNEEAGRYKTAYVIALTGLFMVGWTVHFWNTTYVLVMFLMGAGTFLLDAATEQDTQRSRRRASGQTRDLGRARMRA
jgi:cation transport ATPase